MVSSIAEQTREAGLDQSGIREAAASLLVTGRTMLAQAHGPLLVLGADAVTHAKRALQASQSLHGWHDPRTWRMLRVLALAQSQAGQIASAAETATRAARLVHQSHGEYAPITASAQKEAAVLLLRSGDVGGAIAILEALLTGFCRTRLAKRTGTAAMRGLLAKALARQDRWLEVRAPVGLLARPSHNACA